jgi:hypothetical protein
MNNLYLISQDLVDGYDTYDSAVVSAKDEDEARMIHPSQFVTHHKDGKWMGTYRKDGGEYENESSDWVKFRDIGYVAVKFLGKTELGSGLILSSFNAG